MDVRLIERPNWWSACIICDGIYDHICSCQIIAQGDTKHEAVDNAIAAWNRRAQAGEAYHHHVPDTWERIIEDAREYRLNINGSYLWKNKSDELVARCKALAGDVE